MLSDEEKKELQELVNLLYNGHISQYGKRKLEAYIKKQSKEIEENKKYIIKMTDEQYSKVIDLVEFDTNKKWKDKIKAKIEEKFLETKGLYERGVQPQAQYTMKLLRDLEKSLLEKE